MKTRLTRAGRDVALVIDPAILEELGIDETAEVDVSVESGVLIVRLIRDSHEGRLQNAMKEIDEEYAGVFRRLAKE